MAGWRAFSSSSGLSFGTVLKAGPCRTNCCSEMGNKQWSYQVAFSTGSHDMLSSGFSDAVTSHSFLQVWQVWVPVVRVAPVVTTIYFPSSSATIFCAFLFLTKYIVLPKMPLSFLLLQRNIFTLYSILEGVKHRFSTACCFQQSH